MSFQNRTEGLNIYYYSHCFGKAEDKFECVIYACFLLVYKDCKGGVGLGGRSQC